LLENKVSVGACQESKPFCFGKCAHEQRFSVSTLHFQMALDQQAS